MCCVLGELVGQPDIELLDFDGLECLQSSSAEYRHGMAQKLRITFDGYSTGFLLAPAWRSHSEPFSAHCATVILSGSTCAPVSPECVSSRSFLRASDLVPWKVCEYRLP